jgi:fructose-1,6-bisphosphatase/inositol monophosphatase family enzyme
MDGMRRQRMVQSIVSARWTPVLLEAAENVRTRVRKALLSRASLDVSGLKDLLDSDAQQAIKETLTEADFPVRVVSEEGDYEIGEKGPILVVDPVDGTTNMARGIPFACTSMALSETPHQSGVVIGLVKDLYSGDVYKAERNRGAWRSGKRIAPSTSKLVNEALVSLDVSKGAPVDRVKQLIASAEHLRQTGSAALALCHLASGSPTSQRGSSSSGRPGEPTSSKQQTILSCLERPL